MAHSSLVVPAVARQEFYYCRYSQLLYFFTGGKATYLQLHIWSFQEMLNFLNLDPKNQHHLHGPYQTQILFFAPTFREYEELPSLSREVMSHTHLGISDIAVPIILSATIYKSFASGNPGYVFRLSSIA